MNLFFKTVCLPFWLTFWNFLVIRGGSRTATTSQMELFVIIVNGWNPLTIFHKLRHLGWCSSPRSASGYRLYALYLHTFIIIYPKVKFDFYFGKFWDFTIDSTS